jgi:hypothetical protein
MDRIQISLHPGPNSHLTNDREWGIHCEQAEEAVPMMMTWRMYASEKKKFSKEKQYDGNKSMKNKSDTRNGYF